MKAYGKIATVVVDGRKIGLYYGVYIGNGRPSIRAIEADGETYGTLSVNLPDERLERGEFAAKTYGENEHLANAVRAAGIFETTGKFLSSGHCVYPVWKIKD